MEYATYPVVPEETLPRDEARRVAPRDSGIYFAWEGDYVVYVGLATDIAVRIGTGHHALLPTDRISWVQIDIDDLMYAEAFYIGICTPERNFGQTQERIKRSYWKWRDKQPVEFTEEEKREDAEARHAFYDNKRRVKGEMLAKINGDYDPKRERERLTIQLSELKGCRTVYDHSTSQERPLVK